MTSSNKLSAVFTQLCRAGIQLREVGLNIEAIKCFEALATDDDSYESGDYAFELALCYEAMGEPEKAIHYMTIAVQENPGVYSSHSDAIRIGFRMVG